MHESSDGKEKKLREKLEAEQKRALREVLGDESSDAIEDLDVDPILAGNMRRGSFIFDIRSCAMRITSGICIATRKASSRLVLALPCRMKAMPRRSRGAIGSVGKLYPRASPEPNGGA